MKCDCHRWLWWGSICWWMLFFIFIESERCWCDVWVEVGAEAWLTFPASLAEVEIKWSTFLCVCLRLLLLVFVSPVLLSIPSVFVSCSIFSSLTLNFVHCLDFSLHFPICLCFTLSFTITVHFLHHCLSFSSCPLFLSPFPSHPAEQGSLWCEADIYSCKSFISTVLLLKQWAGSQINKMAERMDLLRGFFSPER